jgi:hypothetical protein
MLAALGKDVIKIMVLAMRAGGSLPRRVKNASLDNLPDKGRAPVKGEVSSRR